MHSNLELGGEVCVGIRHLGVVLYHCLILGETTWKGVSEEKRARRDRHQRSGRGGPTKRSPRRSSQ